MKVICAWCKKDLEDKEPLEDKRISHGMCEKCCVRIMEETAHMGELADPPA